VPVLQSMIANETDSAKKNQFNEYLNNIYNTQITQNTLR
jgi:hypothetical protein